MGGSPVKSKTNELRFCVAAAGGKEEFMRHFRERTVLPYPGGFRSWLIT
jgi:hypothetical protein